MKISTKNQAKCDEKRRSFLKLSGLLGLGAATAALLPVEEAEAVLFGKKEYKISRTGLAMGTYVSMTAIHPSRGEAESAIGLAFEEMDRLSRILSRYDGSSPVSDLNSSGYLNSAPQEVLELVARSIFASKIPVISAVGHEVDVTIADLVADARASTPTQAGVIAVPDYRDELGKLHSLKRRLHLNTRSKIQHSKNQLETVLASRVFRSPLGPVQVAAQRIDELVMALAATLKTRLMRTQGRLDRIREQLQKIEPTRLIASRFMAMSGYDSRNRVGIMKILSKNQLKLAALENRLAALDPRSVLNRGYSITTNARKTGAYSF